MKCFQQTAKFAGGQFPPCTELDAGHHQRTDPHAAKPFDRDADCIHHPPNEVVQSLMHDDFDDQTFIRFTNDADLLRNDALAFDHDSIPQALQGVIGRPGECKNLIFLVEFIAWMHHTIGDITVIRQEQQSFGIAIEPPDRIDTLWNRHEIHHCPSITLILDGCDVAPRFVHEDVARTLRLENFAVDFDDRSNRIGFRTKFGDDQAVDTDSTSLDQIFGGAT